MTVANIITVSRIFITIPAVWLLQEQSLYSLLLALILLNFLELTDAADGMIARARGEVTEIGKLLDPLFDSLCRFTVFAMLLTMGIMPLWMLLVLFYRDVCIAYYRSFAAQRNVTMAARFSGKAKAVIQGVGALLITLVLFAEQMTLELSAGAGLSMTNQTFYGVMIGSWLFLVGFMLAFRLRGYIIWVILAVGGGSSLVAIALWESQFAMTSALAGSVNWWLCLTVSLGTGWSLVDYTGGFFQIVRSTSEDAA